MKWKVGSIGFLLVGLFVVLFVVAGCQRRPEADSGGNPVEVFYEAERKHGFVEFSSKSGSREYGETQRFEYWFDGDRYRLTWYRADGSVRLHMISPDGKVLYHCNPETKTSVVAYTGPEFHQWIFQGPEGFEPGVGVTEGDLVVYSFVAQKLWSIEGASQQFYLEDIRIFTKGGKVTMMEVRTNSTKVAVEDLVTSRYVLKDTDNAVK